MILISDAYVQVKRRPLSVFSAREMRARIENLPSPPCWKEVEVSVEGGTTKDPLTLYYCDGLDCFKFLFGNPLFVDYMDYIPRREFTTGEKPERLYNEIMMGNRAWSLQVSHVLKRHVLKANDVYRIGTDRAWADSRPSDAELGQNPSYSGPGRQRMPCRLFILRQHKKGAPKQSGCALLDDDRASPHSKI